MIISRRGFPRKRIHNPLEVADPKFAKLFHLMAPSGSELPSALSDGVCGTLERLCSLRSPGVQVILSGGRIAVIKPLRMRQQSDLREFVQLSCSLYEQFLLTQAEGIQFVGEKKVSLKDVRCPVCGEVIADAAVLCRRCHTPHHRECWEYFGACTVYGCDERDFVASGK